MDWLQQIKYLIVFRKKQVNKVMFIQYMLHNMYLITSMKMEIIATFPIQLYISIYSTLGLISPKRIPCFVQIVPAFCLR